MTVPASTAAGVRSDADAGTDGHAAGNTAPDAAPDAALNTGFSLYLDAVRFLAAGLVYLSHSNQRWLVADVLPASNYGHSAVVVFFVLSGFVIAHVTATRERDWLGYTASRVSRVMSVVVPALVLTVALDSIGRRLALDVYDYPYDRFAARLVGSLLMQNETWWISITSFSNVPYWSIAYESWYYLAFGLLVFVPGRMRFVAAFAVLLAVGPKVLLLAPIWGLGLALCHWRALCRLSAAAGWTLFVGAAAAIVAFHHAEVPAALLARLGERIGGDAVRELTFSKYVLSDWLLGPLVMLHFAGARRVLAGAPALPTAAVAAIRWAASLTFTLYLMHQPLFLFWGAVLRGDPKGIGFWLTTTVLTALSVALIARYTEARRHPLRRRIAAGLRALTSHRGPPRARATP